MYTNYQTAGQASRNRNLVYAGNNSELYPHEIVHIFTGKYYSTLHPYFDEGLAEYYDFTIRDEKEEGRQKLAGFLLNNPKLNLSNILSLDNHIGGGIDFKYDLSCLIVEKMIEKKGKSAIKEILNGGRNDSDFYRTIEETLEIPRKQFNTTFREWLKEYL